MNRPTTTSLSPLSPKPGHVPPDATIGHLLEPHLLAGLGRLELMASQVMDGFVQGLHRSNQVGFALDFAQHRQYAPGDDIKRIDWRVYGKVDRYYIKQYEVMTNLRATIALDQSASMGYQGSGALGTKFRYGQWIAAALSYLVLHQQDSAGLVLFDTEIRHWIAPRSMPSHLLNITRALDQTTLLPPSNRNKEAEGGRDMGGMAPALHQIAERVGSRGIVVVISDFLGSLDDLADALHHLKHRRQEVLMLQILDPDERTFPFRDMGDFENLENASEKLKLDPVLIRTGYLKALADHIRTLEQMAGKLGFSHALFPTDQALDKILMTYLARRMGSR